ncbi:histone-lysine N-methyltransferase SETMAR-like [Octopus bimaculoides]|uniref:histone-lysine N-methyltransferase SETMAR-like n=1 Tax=Octopus bimaculoides TaxID=37653 RepID=UPI00071D50AB|nr:histone-lysine N-methyltransferase SETMAR-like [Octopus bimaculoides]|eukprot:XP_014780525.1 PREDICTED: histone-lysine N-methyltransferase SETMAR-like [Octopus bimaculoides]
MKYEPITPEPRSNGRELSRNSISPLLSGSVPFIVILGIKPMEDKNFMKQQIRHCLLYEFRKKSTATEAMKNIYEVYPDAAKARTCQLWFKKFKDGDCDISDKRRSGRRPTLNDYLLNATIVSDPCQRTRYLAQKFNVSCLAIHEHLKQIGKTCKEGIWVPHELTLENQRQRSICSSLLTRNNNLSFLQRIVTADEK